LLFDKDTKSKGGKRGTIVSASKGSGRHSYTDIRMRRHPGARGGAGVVGRGHLIEISRLREGWSLSQLMPLKGVEENIDEADEADAIRISDI